MRESSWISIISRIFPSRSLARFRQCRKLKVLPWFHNPGERIPRLSLDPGPSNARKCTTQRASDPIPQPKRRRRTVLEMRPGQRQAKRGHKCGQRKPLAARALLKLRPLKLQGGLGNASADPLNDRRAPRLPPKRRRHRAGPADSNGNFKKECDPRPARRNRPGRRSPLRQVCGAAKRPF